MVLFTIPPFRDPGIGSVSWPMQHCNQSHEKRRKKVEGLDEGSRSFADYLRTSDHLRWARTIEKGTGMPPGLFNAYLQGSESSALLRGMCLHISGIWEKVGQAHTIEKLRGFAYKPLNYGK